MGKWNVNRNGPNWLMDRDGKVVGYRDTRGGEYLLSQTSGVWGASDGLNNVVAGSPPIPVSASFVVTAEDDGKIFDCTTALTVTYPLGLTPRPNIAYIPPPSGNLSIAVSGGATLNGATATLTRTRLSNPAGVGVVAYSESDGYGVSGG